MSKVVYTLYIATNIVNGKQYVGMSKEFKQRLIHHKCAASNSSFHKAIKEYGFENFVFSHIADAFSMESACDVERMLIKQHNTLFPNGYNLTVGGQIGPIGLKHSDETKKKISEANLNRPKEMREKFSKAQKGMVRSQDFKDNISKKLKGKIMSEEFSEKIKQSWVRRKAAKAEAQTVLNNLTNQENHHE